MCVQKRQIDVDIGEEIEDSRGKMLMPCPGEKVAVVVGTVAEDKRRRCGNCQFNVNCHSNTSTLVITTNKKERNNCENESNGE